MLELYGKTLLTADCSKTVKELLSLGKYDSVCHDITDEHFPPEAFEVLGTILVEFKIFRTIMAMEFEQVVLALHKEGYRGASLRQGLNFGIKRPNVHKKISMFLPGSFWRNKKTAFQTRNIIRLSSISNSRHVYLRQLDQVYPAGTFFLATTVP